MHPLPPLKAGERLKLMTWSLSHTRFPVEWYVSSITPYIALFLVLPWLKLGVVLLGRGIISFALYVQNEPL